MFPGVSRRTSGAIHPSVPGIPDRKEKLLRPSGIFLQSPKSEMRARTWPRALGAERRMFLGFRSRWTKSEIREKSNHGNAGKTWKMTSRVCSHLCLASGDVKGRTWSVPGDLRDSAQESKPNPPRTGRVRQRGEC